MSRDTRQAAVCVFHRTAKHWRRAAWATFSSGIYLATGKEKTKILAHPGGRILSLSFSADGLTLVSAGDDWAICVWDLASGQKKLAITEFNNQILRASLSPDGATLASGNKNGDVQLWDAATGKEKIKHMLSGGAVNSICFSPDGARLAANCGSSRYLWDVATGAAKPEIPWQKEWIECLCFSPDGTILASGGIDPVITLWDVVANKEKARLNGPVKTGRSVSFSPNGAMLASGGEGGVILLWDVATRSVKTKLHSYGHAVTSLSFSPDGLTLASAHEGGFAMMWSVGTGTAYGESTTTTGSLQTNWAAYASYFNISNEHVEPNVQATEGIPYLSINPQSHIGILQSGKSPAEIDGMLFWRYAQAQNKTSSAVMLARLPAGKERNEAQAEFKNRFGAKGAN